MSKASKTTLQGKEFSDTMSDAQTPFSKPPDPEAKDFDFVQFMKAWNASVEVQKKLVEAAQGVNAGHNNMHAELVRTRIISLGTALAVLIDIGIHIFI